MVLTKLPEKREKDTGISESKGHCVCVGPWTPGFFKYRVVRMVQIGDLFGRKFPYFMP